MKAPGRLSHYCRNVVHWLQRGAAVCAILVPVAGTAQTIEIGIGTQNTTTNTVTGGIVIKEMKLLEKHLPKTGKYQNANFKIDWQNFTSGPPVTNGMMANKSMIVAGVLACLKRPAIAFLKPGSSTHE